MKSAPITRLAGALLSLVLFSVTLSAEEHSNDGEKDKADIPEPTRFTTSHSGEFNGRRIEYTATAGETYLRNKEGEPKAAIFSFAYTADDADTERPVMFIWNGGPGSASVWLHMGTFGPRRISVPSDATDPGPPPYDIIDAPETILDVCDLVFIDPVGTGFSMALGEHENKEFWGLKEDARSMAEFIRDWVTENGRWNSPKFIMGESFGTTRAAAVANILEGEMKVRLNGLVFVSQALDYAGSSPYFRDNIISYFTYVPTMAATALYHGRVSPVPDDREAFIQASRDFATDELMPALLRGNTLDAETRAEIRDRLAYFTGLSPEYIERSNLRVDGIRFAKELLREQGLAVGRADSRYVRDDIDDLGTRPESDAMSDAISAAFKTALMVHMQDRLGVDWDRTYKYPADGDLGRMWRWRPVPDGQSWEPWPVNTAPDLSNALRTNASLRVLVASGYYDLATPFFDAEYTLNRHDIPADSIQYRYYDGGHMMYIHEPARLQLLEDVRAFVRTQTTQ